MRETRGLGGGRPLTVSVAVPTLNGAATIGSVLAALPAGVEAVILDSESTDGTADVARAHGATVHVIPRREFGHGRARNRLMELTATDRVAFLTQDAVPVEGWLEALTAPADELTYGPYRAPEGAPVSMVREYAELFRALPPTWISSANLCLARRAWTRTPFRDVAYAEDQYLLRDLGGGTYVAEAAVIHGHDYGPVERLRRYFDEFRALHELYGWTAPAAPRVLAGTVRAEVRRDRAWGSATWPSVQWHTARVLGAALGTRAGRLPRPVRARLSLEGRA